jgi:radical SAM-linked protein
VYAVNFAFSKKGDMKFISHLDLMRLLTRALRRADIPVRISQGFNPHPKLSVARAIKVGLESDHEEARISVRWPIEPKDFLDKLNRALPEGIRVVSASLAKQ